MGDRANCIVHQNSYQDTGPVWLYTHWGGYGLLVTVQAALAKKWRWDDDAYLARIIFDQMTKGSHGKETGYGISTAPCDNEHDYVVVDPKAQEVRLEDPDTRKPKLSWSFKEFIDADLSEVSY